MTGGWIAPPAWGTSIVALLARIQEGVAAELRRQEGAAVCIHARQVACGGTPPGGRGQRHLILHKGLDRVREAVLDHDLREAHVVAHPRAGAAVGHGVDDAHRGRACGQGDVGEDLDAGVAGGGVLDHIDVAAIRDVDHGQGVGRAQGHGDGGGRDHLGDDLVQGGEPRGDDARVRVHHADQPVARVGHQQHLAGVHALFDEGQAHGGAERRPREWAIRAAGVAHQVAGEQVALPIVEVKDHDAVSHHVAGVRLPGALAIPPEGDAPDLGHVADGAQERDLLGLSGKAHRLQKEKGGGPVGRRH